MALLDELAEEVFADEPRQPSATGEARGSTSLLDDLADEVFEGKAPPEKPGLLSRAASAVTAAASSAVSDPIGTIAGAAAPMGQVAKTLGFKLAGPAITQDAAKVPTSPAIPKVPTAADLKPTRSSAAIPEPVTAAPTPPVPVKIGPVPGLAPVVEEANKAPLLERVAGVSPSSQVPPVAAAPAPGGILGRAAAAAGFVSPEKARERADIAAFAETSVMSPTAPRTPVGQALRTARRIFEDAPNDFTNRVLAGIPYAIADAFGFDSPKRRAPQGPVEGVARGAADLAGFIAGPAKLAHGMLAGNVTKWIAPRAGDAVGTILARNIASQAATLAVASGIAHVGEEAQAETLGEAYRMLGEHVKGGAMLGAAFGTMGGVIPGNALLPRAARLGVGLTALDAMHGLHPLDDRATAQKAFDYGLNIYFLWNGQDARKIQAVLNAEAKARSKPGAEVTPEEVLKSALDKAQERATRLPKGTAPAEERAALEASLKAVFAEEVGDIVTGTTASELRTAREVAEQKTGGAVPQREVAQPAPVPARPEIVLPGGQVGTTTGPVRLFGPTGRPVEAQAPPVVPEAPAPLRTAQERAEERVRAITPPGARLPQPAPAAAPQPSVSAKATERPTSALSFKDYVEVAGKRWPLTSRDPDYARLRFEFDDMRKGLYESRPASDGRWAVINRKTGEEVDHLQTGAKAQLEANRLNSVITLDAWRNAQIPTPIRMVLPQASKPDLAAKPAQEAKPEAGTPAAEVAATEKATVTGPKPSAEPPAPAKAPPPPVTRFVPGKTQEIRVPAGSKYQIRYEVVPAEDIVPSHHPKTFAKDPRYPEGVQNRPYHSDKSEQAKVIRQGQDFEPLFLVSPQPSSGGTPIVAPDSNVVLSGNSRTMTLLRTLGSKDYERYRQALTDMAPALGIKVEDIAKIEHPVLVRRLVGTDTTPEFYRRFAKETNEGFKQALNTQAAAVSQGQAVKPQTMEWIAGAVDALGETATLRDFLRSGRDRELIRRFIQDGVFTERDLSRYIDPRTSQLNEDGKRLVERAILGNAIPDPDLLVQAPASIVAKIERSLGALSKIKGRGGAWDLGKDLEDAVRTVVQVQATEAGSVGALRRQGSLLEPAAQSPRADTLADALLRMKPNDFKAAIGRYAEEGQRDVREQETLGFAKPEDPASAFRKAFGEGYGVSGSPSGPSPTEASRSGRATGEFIKSPTEAPPGVQREPSQVSMLQESGPGVSRETAPSFQISPGTMTRPPSTPSLTQPQSDINGIRELAERTKPGFEAALQGITRNIPGASYLGSRVKAEQSVIDKMQRKPGRPAASFDDYLGGRIQADKPETLSQVITAIKAKYPEHTEDNFLETPNVWGYRANHMTVKTPTGLVAEIQIVPEPIADYQAGPGHPAYKRWRSTTPSTPEEIRQAQADMTESNAQYQKAYDRWRGTTTQKVAAPAAPSKPPELRMRRPVPKPEEELIFAISGASDAPIPGDPQSPGQRLPKDVYDNLVKYGGQIFAESPARSYPDFARRLVEKLGPKVKPYLPEVWGEVLREAARTQRNVPAGQERVEAGKPPEPPTEVPRTAPPIDPPPGMTDPQLKLGLHKRVLDAAEALFRVGKIERDPKTLLSDQILAAIRDGKLRIEDMSKVLDERSMTFAEFGSQMFRPAITDAAKRLGALGQLQRRLNELESELAAAGAAGKPPTPGKPGAPGDKERQQKIKTIGDILDAARVIDPKAVDQLAWWRRADNIRRGMLVTQLATSVRNFTTQVGRLGLDVLDQGLQGALQRVFGKEVTTHPADSFRALMEVFSQANPSKHAAVKAKVDTLLEGLPREQDRLFNNYSSDLIRAAKKQGAEKAVDAGLSAAERTVDLLNVFNRFQEYVVRRSVFQAELAGRLRTRGIDIEQAVKDPTIRREIPLADIRASIDKALEVTFASSPAYGSSGYHFVRWVNRMGPAATWMVPFPRFMVNALKFYLEFSPVGLVNAFRPAELQKFRQGDTKAMSRGLLGLGLLSTAYLVRSMQDEDTKWNEVRLPGMERTIDVRPLNPFAAYLFAADLLYRMKNNRLYGGGLATESIRNILGANVRGGTGLQAVDQLVDGIRDIGDTRALTKYLQGAGGHLVAGLLTPLQQFTDLYAEFDPESQIVRNTREHPFTGPIKQRFPTPLVEALGGELPEEKASPTSPEPVKRESPGLRQVSGITLGKAKNDFEKELDRLQIPYREILPSQRDPRLDNILARYMGQEAETGNRIVNSARYQRLGEIGKRLELKAYLQRLRKKAKAKAMTSREYREITREVKAGTSKERLAEIAREEHAGLR